MCISGTARIDGDHSNSSNCSGMADVVYDEVEDLFQLLQEVKHTYPDIEGVSCGAIVSTYQRLRVENVCSRLNLTCLAYLWQRDRMELLHEMMTCGYNDDNNDEGTEGRSGISSNGNGNGNGNHNDSDHCEDDNSSTRCPIDAVLIKVAGAGLDPLKHLNRSIVSLLPVLTKLHHQLGLDVCGEGGEYESLVLDCSAFKKYKLVLEETTVVVDDENCSVGYLKIIKCSCQLKGSSSSSSNLIHNNDASLLFACRKIIEVQKGVLIGQKDDSKQIFMNKKKSSIQKAINNTYNNSIDSNNSAICHHNHNSPHNSPTISINKDGIGQSSLIFAKTPVQTEGILDRCQQIKLELKKIMTNLQHLLSKHQVILADIVFIHLYIERYENVVVINNNNYCYDDDDDDDDVICNMYKIVFIVVTR